MDDGTVLQNALDKLSFWESQWDMEFNPSKCQVVQVTTARKAINTVTVSQCIPYIVRSWKLSQMLGTWGLTSAVAYLGAPTLTVLLEMQIELWVTFGEILNKKPKK